MAVAAKIGGGAPAGSVFHGRVRTGEIVKVDAPGRDAIVSRILALKGLEANNSQAFSRGIYIHGTPEERNIGRPTSYGCIRMRSKDVIALYDMVKVGARVQIIDTTQNQAIAANIIGPTPGAASDAAAPATIPVPGEHATEVASAGNTSVVKSITTTGSGPTVKTTTTATAATASGSTPATTTTTVVTKAAPPFPAVAAALNKKTWNAAPSKLLATQAAADARAQHNAAKPPIGAPTPTPVSNNTSAGDASTQHHATPSAL